MPKIQICVRYVVLVLLGICWVTSVSASAQSLTVSTGENALTIHPGDTNVPLPVSLGTSNFAAPVTVTVTGLPSGITVAPLTLVPGATGILQLSASVSAGQEFFSSTLGPGSGDIATTNVTVAAFSGSVQASATVALTISLENSSFSPAASNINLPIVTINTNGVGILSKTVDVPGTITITSADGQTSYLPGTAGSDDTALFHVHGNSTAMMPKLPYEVKLNTSTDLLPSMGLNCGYVTSSGTPTCDKNKHYVLLANYADKTLLRDWSASALANSIPSGNGYLAYSPGSPTPTGTSALGWWAPHSLFVELYVNGVYEGNYQLIEEVEVDSHRVNVAQMAETAVSGTALTGGYFLEIDQRQAEDYVWITPEGVYIGLKAPDFTPEVPEQTAYINSYVNAAEGALFSSNYTDPVLGWRAYFDQTSAVNFYIVNDLMGNVDAGDFYSSNYLYKDASNPLIYMGPVWDFDISSGNTNYVAVVNPTVPWMQTQAVWYIQWFSDPGFKAAVVQQWNALKNGGVFAGWMASISQEAATLQQSQINNFGRWPMQGEKVWPNPEAAGSYSGELAYMTDWIALRFGYLDALFNNKAATTTSLTSPTGTLLAGSPVTLSAKVSGTGTPTGSVTFTSNSVLLGAGTLSSSGVATLTTSALLTGTDSLQAVYGGDTVNGLSASSLVSVDIGVPLSATVTNLTTSTSSAGYGSQVVLSAAVVANSGTTLPTGTVTFSSNAVPIGTAALSSGGLASLTLSSLPPGSDVIQAGYGGDSSNQVSSSNTATIAILPGAPVFSLPGGTYTSAQTLTITSPTAGAQIYYTLDGSTPSAVSSVYVTPLGLNFSQTVTAVAGISGVVSPVTTAVYTITPTFTLQNTTGQSSASGWPAMLDFTVTPLYNFSQPVTLSCVGLPKGDVCTFSPATVSTTAGPASTNLVISGNLIADLQTPHNLMWKMIPGGMLTALLLLPFRRRRFRMPLVLCLFALVISGVTGCSSSTVQPPFTVTVTAVGGAVTQTVIVQVVP